MPDLPVRKTERMRVGRVSLAGARYFWTICTRDREPVLTRHPEMSAIKNVCSTMDAAGDFSLIVTVVMPDHAHLLFTLGERLSLNRVMAKFKASTRRSAKADWWWQENGFEHRLRPEESAENYAFYMFMNPYRAGLINMRKAWSGWICPQPEGLIFSQGLDADGAPPAEWLEESKRVAGRIVVRSPDRL